MLYYLYELSEWLPKHGIDNDFVKALNVFHYITFRAISAAERLLQLGDDLFAINFCQSRHNFLS